MFTVTYHVTATAEELLTALNQWAVANEGHAGQTSANVKQLKAITCAILDRPGALDLTEGIDLGDVQVGR